MQAFVTRMKTDRWLMALAAIFLIGLALRLWGVTQPLLDFHSWRQTLTATVAKNFYLGDMNLFRPATNWAVEYYEFEFPIYTYSVALLYKLFGFHDSLGRVVSIAFGLGSMALLHLLTKRFFGRSAALFATGLFAVLPMAVYYTRTFMPEPAMLFFSIAGLYCFSRWLDFERWSDFFLAAAAFSLAFLIKLPTLFLGGPILFLAWLKFKGRMFLLPQFYLFLAILFVPPLLWYGHMGDLHAEAHAGQSIWLNNDKLANSGVLLDYKFYKLIFWTRLGEKMFAFTGFFFVLMGLATKLERREQYVFHIWFASVCVYFLIAAEGNRIHEYYQLPILPAGCALAGKFLADFFARRKDRLAWRSDWKLCAVTLMLVFIPVHSVYKLEKRLRFNTDYLTIGEKIKTHTGKEEFILLQDTHANRPQAFYFSDRKGWTLGMLPPLSAAQVQDYARKGARYFGWVRYDFAKTNPALLDHLRQNHETVVAHPLVTLFKLTP